LNYTFSKVKGEQPKSEIITLQSFIGVTGLKTKGKKLSDFKIKDISLKEPEEIKQARRFLNIRRIRKIRSFTC